MSDSDALERMLGRHLALGRDSHLDGADLYRLALLRLHQEGAAGGEQAVSAAGQAHRWPHWPRIRVHLDACPHCRRRLQREHAVWKAHYQAGGSAPGPVGDEDWRRFLDRAAQGDEGDARDGGSDRGRGDRGDGLLPGVAGQAFPG